MINIETIRKRLNGLDTVEEYRGRLRIKFHADEALFKESIPQVRVEIDADNMVRVTSYVGLSQARWLDQAQAIKRVVELLQIHPELKEAREFT